MKLITAARGLFMACLTVAHAAAADVPNEQAERDRIAAERARAEAAFAVRERECHARFVVTSCLDAARRDRRQALERLRQQQVVLDEAERKQRAAKRMETIRSAVSDEESRRRAAEARAHRKAERPFQPAPSSVPPPMPAEPASTPAAASRGASPAPSQRAAEYDRRQAAAKQHREAVQRRNAEGAARGKTAKPLPLPPAASAP